MNALIAPSILSGNFAALALETDALEKAGISWLHLDVMDGQFAPNITFGTPVIASLRKQSGLFFDVHLMVMDPGRYIQNFINAGADIIVPHIEAMLHPQRTLAAIAEGGAKAGIAINPDTEITRLRYLLPYVDMILIMGVNPGFSGQKFLPLTLKKIRDCRQFLEEQDFGDMPIEVDGGADASNASQLVEAGANVLVSGSAFFRHNDFNVAAESFARALDNSRPGLSTRNALQKVCAWKHRNP